MIARGRDWFRRASIGELIAVAGGLAVFGYLGWDQPLWDAPSQTAFHLVAIGAVGGLFILVMRRAEMPRTSIDAPVLTVLMAIGVASVFGQSPGLAAGAFAASLAFALMLPISLIAIRKHPGLTALVVLVPTLWLALGTIAQLVTPRFDWYLAGGPSLIPPVRIGGETTAFGSVAVPPFILLGALPLAFAIPNATVRRILLGVTIAMGVILSALSGSRSAWIAAAAAIVVFAAPELRRLSRFDIRRPSRRQWALLAGAGILVLGLIVYEGPRLTALSSLVYRGRLWSDTLEAWRSSPWIGIGPGTMPYARQAAAAQFPLHQAHSHDVALGILGDAGFLGLALGAFLVVGFFWVAGPHRSRTLLGRAATAVLAGYLAASFFEDLTFLPNFSLIVVLLAGLALTDAGAVAWRPIRAVTPVLAFAGAAAITLTAAVLARDGAALAYRAGADTAAAAQWPAATRWFAISEAIDPWQPSTPKSLAIAADASGDDAAARAAATRATSLNAGDGASWTNLAILCLRARDDACALEAAHNAGDAATVGGAQLIDAAMVLNDIGDFTAADELYVLDLRNNRNVALATIWPRPLRPGALPESSTASPAVQLNLVLGRAAGKLPIDPSRFSSPAVRAYAEAMNADEPDAREALAQAQRSASDDVLTWEISAVLARHWGEDPSHAVAVANVLRGGPTSVPTLPSQTWDVASFRSYPLDELLIGANHLLPDEAWPWSLDRFLP
jgi:O-Antigen ligase